MMAQGYRRTLLAMAVLAGATQIAAGVTMYAAGVYFRPWSMLVSLAVLLAWIAGAMAWLAGRAPGGRLGLARAVAVGVAVSVSTGVLYAAYNLVTIEHVYRGFLDEVVRLRADAARHRGASEAAIAGLAAQTTAARIALENLVRLTVLGTVATLPMALVLRTRRAAGPARAGAGPGAGAGAGAGAGG